MRKYKSLTKIEIEWKDFVDHNHIAKYESSRLMTWFDELVLMYVFRRFSGLGIRYRRFVSFKVTK